MEEPLPPPTNLDQLYDYLKRFALSDSLFIAGVVTATMRYGYHALETSNTPEGTIRWINDHGTEVHERFRVSMLLTRMARFLLLSSSNDYKALVLDTGTHELDQALYLTSTLHDRDVEGEITNMQDVGRIFGRLGQWQFPLQANRMHIIGRGYMLFLQIPEETQPAYNFDEKMNEHFGIGIYPFIATGLALWITNTGILQHNMMVEVEEMKDVVTKETVEKFVELSTGTAEHYRRLVRGEDWKTPNKRRDIYGLDPFIQIPAIKIEHSTRLEPGTYVVPQAHYLLQKATSGIFYLLSDKERDDAIAEGYVGRNYFRDSFGDVYRSYVGKQLALASEPSTFIDIDEEIETGGMIPDFAIVEGTTCILFEVKTALLTVNSRTIFDDVTAREEVQKGGFKKALEQLNSFEKAILLNEVRHAKLQNIERVVKVMVGFEDIYLVNSFLLPMLRDIYGDDIGNLQIATISDIETVGRLLAGGVNLSALMIEKIATPHMAEWSLGAFLNQKSEDKTTENPILKKAFEDFMSRMTGMDYDSIRDPL